MSSQKRKTDSRHIVKMRVDVTNYEDACGQITDWAERGESRYVCVANVHMVMETYDNSSFLSVLNNSDMITPDGMPLVWALKTLGIKKATKVRGANLTLEICESAVKAGISIGLYGGTKESLTVFTHKLHSLFPGIQVVCQIAPPFRQLTKEEDSQFTKEIVESGAQIVFVGIGCPKQENWMAEHKGRIPAVMVGVGAAFDFIPGNIKQAPLWMQELGLEWCFRIWSDPKRLWKRYAKNNPRFVALFVLQLLGLQK